MNGALVRSPSEKRTAAVPRTACRHRSRGSSAEPPPPPLSPWDSRRHHPVSPTNAESLAALSEAALARPASGVWDRSAAERYQVILHVDAQTLSGDAQGACAIADGPGIAPETARRLACDGSVVALVERDGKPLSVGRRTRSVPASTRRALLARDGRCQFPGRERRRFVEPTTSSTGTEAARPASTIWSCSVAITTGSCTRAATRSTSPRRAGGSFATPPATRSPPLPRHRPIRRRSRPRRAACSPAPARRWTWATAWMRCWGRGARPRDA